jgi:diaminohydroxyphosphoribosylaminopyrimidine deaminase/5-amino-6-(5-phosphoribosylamino)uracil reductase
MVASCREDLAITSDRAASASARSALASSCWFRRAWRTRDLRRRRMAGRQRCLSLLMKPQQVELGCPRSMAVDKIFFYYTPKILGGIESLPMAGGVGRRRRIDAIRLRDLKHSISSRNCR